ncbi:MAG: carbohydrate-binding family V/XII, partial [Thermoanaerobaculia bacterium]
MSLVFRRLALASILVAAAAALGVTLAQDAFPATEADAPQEELQWPRVVERDGMTFTIYQPQIDKFADAMLEARAAVKVDTKVGEKTQTSYGVVWITAQAFIDKENELVELSDIQVNKA